MITGPSGRAYDPLPIDNTAGFPQQFPLLLNGVNYQFRLYVDVPAAALGPIDEVMVLPDAQRFLVVRADILGTDGTTQTVFLRKVVPSLEYSVRGIGLYFPTQIVARRNLNGVGSFGSNIVAGVASL
jgi:hypothetical protein